MGVGKAGELDSGIVLVPTIKAVPLGANETLVPWITVALPGAKVSPPGKITPPDGAGVTVTSPEPMGIAVGDGVCAPGRGTVCDPITKAIPELGNEYVVPLTIVALPGSRVAPPGMITPPEGSGVTVRSSDPGEPPEAGL